MQATADGSVSPSQPRNAGPGRWLEIGPGRGRTYLRLIVPRLSPALAVARLRVWAAGRSAGFVVAAASGRWREATLTYRNAPTPRGLTIASGPVHRAGWQTVDVTPLVRAGERTLVLESAGGTTRIAGREDRRHAARLWLQAGAPQPPGPIRAAFFYAWYPEAWRQDGRYPYTHYQPSLGFYDSGSRPVVAAQVEAMRYAHLDAAIVSWWGRGSPTDTRLPRLLSASRSGFHWAVYDEREGQGNPAPSAIRRDLLYLRARAAASPSYLRIGGRFVVFVYAQPSDGCAMARRWQQANTVGAFVVLKVFPGYRGCRAQPDGWHQYAPAEPEDDQRPYSFSISPGFFAATEASPRLSRDLAAWRRAVDDMVASHARFELVTTFNEWGEGTAVESAREWQSSSGYGSYLDTLHAVLPARRALTPTARSQDDHGFWTLSGSARAGTSRRDGGRVTGHGPR